MSEKVIVTEVKNKVIVKTPGPQGPAGRTILNGTTAPANNLGVVGDFYYNTVTTDFYGPKLTDLSWSGATVIKFIQEGSEYSHVASWEISQLQGPINGVYSFTINHNLGFYPNATCKDSSGSIVETGIDYNNSNTITLTMAQPFSGTAYLS
jgi:hypothetical protein